MLDAGQVHADSLVIDSHNDSLVAHLRRGNRSLVAADEGGAARPEGLIEYLRGPLDSSVREAAPQITLAKLRQGGVDAAFFAVDCTRARKNHLAYALDGFGFLLDEIRRCPEGLVLARSAADVESARRQGKLAAILALENSDGLEGSLYVLHCLHALGVRSVGLTHDPRSDVGDGARGERDGSGLTHFGVRVIRELNRLGIIVDVAHLNRKGFWDVIEISEKPVFDSHACCRALCDHPRNLDDEQLRALAETGGVLGLTFVRPFLAEDWRAVTTEHILNHLDHAVQLVGSEHVGLGSDFDGGGEALPDIAAYPRLTEGMLSRGYGEDAVRQILGLNHLRVLRETVGA